uniref:Interleukin-12 subunit alpha n=1 Tax=Hucho hucho TaxID=62062 RepID=A0A4W5PD59_9TELE
IVSSLHTDLASCVLLLALSCQVSMGTPMRTPPSLDSAKCSQCADLSRELVKNVRKLLDNENLFGGLNCSEQRVEVNSKTQTVLACEPNPDRSECLRNIRADLGHYAASLQAYKQAELSATAQDTQNLLNICPSTQGDPSSHVRLDFSILFFRVHLCKVLKGFHLRVITISRAMGYISAGDHRK